MAASRATRSPDRITTAFIRAPLFDRHLERPGGYGIFVVEIGDRSLGPGVARARGWAAFVGEADVRARRDGVGEAAALLRLGAQLEGERAQAAPGMEASGHAVEFEDDTVGGAAGADNLGAGALRVAVGQMAR